MAVEKIIESWGGPTDENKTGTAIDFFDRFGFIFQKHMDRMVANHLSLAMG